MEGILFIGTVIAGITQAIKLSVPKVNGAVTIAIAALVGVIVALVDTQIGVVDLTVAEGIMAGLGAAGVTAIVKQAGTRSE